MKRIAIDTMIVDALLADPAVLEALRAARAAGQVVVVKNHVVRDQLAAIKDAVKREAFLAAYDGLPGKDRRRPATDPGDPRPRVDPDDDDVRAYLDAAPDGDGGAAAGGGSVAMQQIRILDEATRIPGTGNMRLMLSDQPDQTWIARLRQLAAATADGPALNLRVEGRTLVFACEDRAHLLERRRLIGQLVDQANASEGAS